jgi:hypothetical protein
VVATHKVWLEVWELGWSMERIAETWHKSEEYVEAVLDELSMQPLHPRVRRVPELPASKKEAERQRAMIRHRYQQGWSIAQLAHYYLYYGEEVLQKIVGQGAPAPQSPIVTKLCRCGCGAQVREQKKWATPGCRKRVQRGSVMA